MEIERLTVAQVKLMRILKLKRRIPRQEILIKFDWNVASLNFTISNLRGYFIIVENEKSKKGGRPRQILSLNEAGETAIKAFDLANKNG